MMGDQDEYVPREGDFVVFDRSPAEDPRHRMFRVASHDAETGMTTLRGLTRALSAQEMADLGARNAPLVSPDQIRSDWPGVARKIATDGAGSRSKIYQLRGPLHGHWSLKPHTDSQAALALAQRAADETGEPYVLAETRTGELVIGSLSAQGHVSEGLGTQTLLVVQPSLPGDSGSVTLRHVRELLGSIQVREGVRAALASAGLTGSASSIAADAVLQVIAESLPPEHEKESWLPPGWRYRAELMPRIAEILARAQLEQTSGS